MNYYTRRRMRAMARLAGGESILDIGCAAGPNPYLCAKRVVGFDREKVQVRPPYTEHVCGDVYDLDRLLPGEVFDTILLGELILQRHFARRVSAPAAQTEFSTAPKRFRCAVGTETHRAKVQVAL